MARQRPQVIDGVRSGSNAPALQSEQDGDGYVSTKRIQELEDERASALPEPLPMVEYQSRFANLRWSMKINHDVIIDGRVVRGADRHIQFNDFVYRTNKQDEIDYIESRKQYGVGRVVWRTQDLTDSIMFDAVDKTIGMIEAAARHSPKALGVLAKRLGAKDFDILKSLAGYAEEQTAERKTA